MVERDGAVEAQGSVPQGERAEEAASKGAESLVELVLSEHAERHPSAVEPPKRPDGIVLGVLAGVGPGGEPLVDFVTNPRGEPVPARSTVGVDEADVGRDVALMFEGGDATKPILLGLIHRPEPAASAEGAGEATAVTVEPVEVEVDGEKVVVSAQRELVLRCGKASITLTSAGKILIRGAYVLTRSSGVNRIQGGSVQIN
jgi:hypothetical protein